MNDQYNPFDPICALFREPRQDPSAYRAEVINLRQKKAEKLARERQARWDLFTQPPPKRA